MSRLAPNLFERRFADLVEIGRARLPSLAPDWTDHNAHDPGLTLMELLAWVAEAQLYSLSHLRRDERRAYAALLGLAPAGTQSATGLLWSDRLDPDSPVTTFMKSVVLSHDTIINAAGAEGLTFRPVDRLLWAPGRIQKLEARGPGGRTIDHTTINERGGIPFLPFGERAGSLDVLAIQFQCRDKEGLFGSKRQDAKGARWPIGILVAPPLGGAPVEPATSTGHSPLAAKLVTDNEQFNLKITSDSTQGLLTTGALLLDLDNVTTSPKEFTLELHSRSGFPRPPRVLRIEPNVLPIQQGHKILSELHVATGVPDWTFSLDVPGLRFGVGEEPINLEVAEPAGLKTWRRCKRLSDAGPDENVYELDTDYGEVTFGNNINGRIPPADSQVLVTYAVSDGEEGRVARNRKWKVAGFEGTFGVNPDPISGGAATYGWIDQRREARRRSKDDHALVSADDIASAGKALPLLEVARAWVAAPDDRQPRTGAVTLIALRSRPHGIEPNQPPETPRWLEAIGRRLAPRMPLGTRLIVAAPRYIEFSIHASLETDRGLDPSVVKKEVEKALQKRLALIDLPNGGMSRQPGVPVTRRDVAAWLRAINGIRSVVELELRGAERKSVDKVAVPRSGLPRWNPALSTIEVQRPEGGGRDES